MHFLKTYTRFTRESIHEANMKQTYSKYTRTTCALSLLHRVNGVLVVFNLQTLHYNHYRPTTNQRILLKNKTLIAVVVRKETSIQQQQKQQTLYKKTYLLT